MESFVLKLNEAIINPLIAVLFAIALAVFAWGLFVFVAKANDQEARDRGKRHMLWSIIGLFIMVGVFGILRILLNTFNVDLEQEQEELIEQSSQSPQN